MQCAAHPNTETELRCSRCETPICPRCLVQTPVGARCKACARANRPAIYQVSAGSVARGLAASLLLGAVAGVLWGLILPGTFSFIFLLGFFIAIALGSPIGYFFADLLDRVTGRKRGPVMQVVAVAGLVTAWLVHGIIGGALQTDFTGMILTFAACAAAVSRLR